MYKIAANKTCSALGKRYNIPVSLWLKESYPRTAPICYLKPTSEMVIVPSRHVNSSGEITMPYLDEWRHVRQHTQHPTIVLTSNNTNNLQFYLFLWNYLLVLGGLQTQCDLHSLIQVIMAMFSEVPPLRMRLYPEDCEYSFLIHSHKLFISE